MLRMSCRQVECCILPLPETISFRLWQRRCVVLADRLQVVFRRVDVSRYIKDVVYCPPGCYMKNAGYSPKRNILHLYYYNKCVTARTIVRFRYIRNVWQVAVRFR